jgi:hypothetical protein
MHRTVVTVMGIVVAGCCLGTPQAAADDPLCGPRPGCEFRSPARDISCEFQPDSVYCQTFEPQQSVTMDSSGALTISKDVGNPDTVLILDIGHIATNGPFTCRSVSGDHIICTVQSGKGFDISASPGGVAPVG